MKSVNIERNELLNTVRLNREHHVEEYKLTREAWHRECLNTLQSTHSKMKKDSTFIPHAVLLDPEPQSHAEDYNRVIKMLEMSVDDVIELPLSEFDQYVMDNWQWKQQFTQMSTKYRVGGRV